MKSASPYSPHGYEARADQCLDLARQAKDKLIRMELMKLRRTYLAIAQRLKDGCPWC